MGKVEVVGYIRDGSAYCLECWDGVKDRYAQDRIGHNRVVGTPIFDTDDMGPEGLFCECGETIKPSYGNEEE